MTSSTTLTFNRHKVASIAKGAIAPYGPKFVAVVAVCLTHVPLAILIYRFNFLAALHAACVLIVGLRYALSPRRQMYKLVSVVFYLAGAEVLWRTSSAPIPWETGKYGIVVLLLVAMIRHKLSRLPLLPCLYFALLLPSSLLTVNQLGLDARQALSFYLSGPLALAACASFFSQVKLTKAQLHEQLLPIIYPMTSIAAIAIFGTITTEDLIFNGESNLVTSGGFGPNQVSTALGCGAFVAFFSILSGYFRASIKALLIALVIFFAAQSAMTFSRGGLYCTAGASIVAVLFMSRNSRDRLRLLGVVTVLASASYFIVIPRLDAFTGEALITRFSDTGATNREELIVSDYNIWTEMPLLGAGPGGAKVLRRQVGERGSSHTEFTRMISEHGILGILSILFLVGAGIVNLIRQKNPLGKALSASFMIWGYLYMMNAAMRLVAPSLMIGFAFVAVIKHSGAYKSASADLDGRVGGVKMRAGRSRMSPEDVQGINVNSWVPVQKTWGGG